MSKRDSNWNKLFEDSHISERLQKWLSNNEEITFQIKSNDFTKLRFKPVRMIPTYHEEELPKILKSKGINLLRNEIGGCLLIKTRDFNLPSLFPRLSNPQNLYRGPPFSSVPELELYNSRKLINEETGIYLAWSMGVIQDFLSELFSTEEKFYFGGRLKTNAEGRFQIKNKEFKLDAIVECDAYFESRKNVVILECKRAKSNFVNNFSLHQLLLPFILVKSEITKSTSCIFFDFMFNNMNKQESIIFRLFHFEFENKELIDPFEYKFTKSKKYIIDLHKTIDSF